MLLSRSVDSETRYVDIDNRLAGRLLGTHLEEVGVRSLAFLGGHAENAVAANRRHGLMDAFAGTTMKRPITFVPGNSSPTEGVRMTGELLDNGASPDAIVAFSDAIASGIYAELSNRGVRPGRDVAIAGFDDIRESRLHVPPLTTVATFPDLMGEMAADLILECIAASKNPESSASGDRRRLAEPKLRIRASTMSWRPRS